MELLQRLKAVWLPSQAHPDGIMLWAAACTGFLGFLRAGEFTVQSPQAYDPEANLSIGDLTLDSHQYPSLIRLHIKQSKTDPFRQGVHIYLGATGADVCPVQALIQYIAVRNPEPGPLFQFSSGRPLTKSTLASHLHAALQEAGVVFNQYNGHSFRIGAATTAAQ